MKRAKRIALVVLAVLGVLLLGFGIYVGTRQNLRFDHPLPDIHAGTDPAVVARGEYLVRRLANCAICHGDPSRSIDLLKADDSVPLSGGHTWKVPPGVFRAYNITPDRETGVGTLSDGQIARRRVQS